MATHTTAALKEWKIVVDALAVGEQLVLLRKGGLVDVGGVFAVDHREFLLFPTYLHQKADWLNAEWRPRLATVSEEPSQAELSLLATVTDVVRLSTLESALALEPHTIWSRAFLEMRWNYRPSNPLVLVLVRVARLVAAHRVELTAEYAGCKSWVELRQPLATEPAEPVLSDADFARRRDEVLTAVRK